MAPPIFLHLTTTLMSAIAAVSRARASLSTSGTPPQAPPYLATLALAGDASVIATHATNPYTPTATDQYGQPFVGTPGPYTYLTSDATKATVTNGGIATGVAAGTTTIRAQVVNSLGQTITSNGVTLTVSAQVATSPIAVNPGSATLSSGTRQFTAVVSDQGNPANVISGAAVSWDTDDHAVATVNGSGLLAAVGNGTCTLTATSGGATGTASIAVSVSSVTAVTAYYNSVPATQLLFRTGSSYAFSAKDQAGNLLSGVGTWSTSDGTDFPIDSTTGVLTPGAGAAGKGVTITYTHTATQHVATCTGTAVKPTTTVRADAATNYANDTAFMANVGNNLGVTPSYNSNLPTGGSNSLYVDGLKVNQITIDNTAARQFMGNKVFNVAIPVGGGAPILSAALGQGYSLGLSRVWCMVLKRYDPGFSTVGTGNPGSANAYKDAPWFLWRPGIDGRSGIEYTNTTGIDLGCAVGSSSVQAGSSTRTIGNGVGSAFNDGLWLLDFALYEIRSGRVMSARAWRTLLGTDVPSWLTNNSASGSPTGLVEGGVLDPNASPAQAYIVTPFGANYNQGVPTQYNKQVAFWEVVDGTTYGDPYGILGTQPTPVLSGISGGTVTQNDTQKVITLTGTGFNYNCYPVFSNAGVRPSWLGDGVTPITLVSSTRIDVTVDVLGSASVGAGTVAIYNAGSQVTSATQAVTVQAAAPPGAPSASNASAANYLTLTFPVTLNASGTLPSTLPWQYRVNGSGGSFTAGTPVTLTNPSLGQSLSVDVSLPTASTTYDVQFAEANAGGTSSYSSTVTGTTQATPSLISANLVLDLDADAGLDVSTDGAGVGSWTDQSNTAAQFFQGTGSKKPILKLALYNGHNALRFTAANSCNLTSGAAISAINTPDATIYVVAKSNVDNASTDGRFFSNLNASKQGYQIKIQQNTTTAVMQVGNGTAFTSTNMSTGITAASGPHILSLVLDHTTPVNTPYVDGQAQPGSSAGFAACTISPPFVSVGSQSGGANGFLDCDILRILQYSTIHNSTQEAQNTAALKALYGIA